MHWPRRARVFVGHCDTSGMSSRVVMPATKSSRELFAQGIAFECPNLVAGVAPGDLLANLNVKVLRACRRALSGHGEAVAQLQAAHRQRRAGKNVVVLAGISACLSPWLRRGITRQSTRTRLRRAGYFCVRRLQCCTRARFSNAIPPHPQGVGGRTGVSNSCSRLQVLHSHALLVIPSRLGIIASGSPSRSITSCSFNIRFSVRYGRS